MTARSDQMSDNIGGVTWAGGWQRSGIFPLILFCSHPDSYSHLLAPENLYLQNGGCRKESYNRLRGQSNGYPHGISRGDSHCRSRYGRNQAYLLSGDESTAAVWNCPWYAPIHYCKLFHLIPFLAQTLLLSSNLSCLGRSEILALLLLLIHISQICVNY